MITDEQINKCLEVAKRYGVKKLVLFGSALYDRSNARDIDLLCDGVEGREFFKMGADMENETMKSVDIIPMSPDSRFVQYNLAKGKVLHDA